MVRRCSGAQCDALLRTLSATAARDLVIGSHHCSEFSKPLPVSLKTLPQSQLAAAAVGIHCSLHAKTLDKTTTTGQKNRVQIKA